MGKQGRTTHRASDEPQGLGKIAIGMAGLDDILEGGFPAGRTTLISGGPGTGKTMLGLEFLYKSALAGKAGILLLFEERADAIRRNVRSLGWDLAKMEKAGKLFILEARLPRDAILTGDFTITPLLAIVEGKAKAMGADRIVIDAIDVLMRVYNDSRREQNELYGLHDWLIDTIILLRFVEIYNKVLRSLLILKSRGAKHSNSYHRFVITDNGIEITAMAKEARLSELHGQASAAQSPAETEGNTGGEES